MMQNEIQRLELIPTTFRLGKIYGACGQGVYNF